jgi:hypothetical protein
LGPIAPFGSLLHTSAVLALKRDSQDDPAVLEWLQVATGRSEVALPLPQLLEKDMWRVSSTVVIQPHSLPGRVVALKVSAISSPPCKWSAFSHFSEPMRAKHSILNATQGLYAPQRRDFLYTEHTLHSVDSILLHIISSAHRCCVVLYHSAATFTRCRGR